MPTWVYQARDRTGKAVTGSREAADRQSAINALREEGLFLTRLDSAPGRVSAPKSTPKTSPKPPEPRPSAPASFQSGTSATPPTPKRALLRASSKHLSLFFRQIGAMIHAGTSLGQALATLSTNASAPALRTASAEMHPRVMGGEQLSECMRSYPGLFTPLHIGLVKAGERGGFLDTMFARLSQYSERDYELQQTIKRETWYPKLLVFASILIPSAVPLVLAKLMPSGVSPLAAWLHAVVPQFLAIGIALFVYKIVNFASPLAGHLQGPKRLLDNVKLMTPVFGKVVRGLATAKFCRALGSLNGAGVGAGESVRLAAEACGNGAIAHGAISIIPRLENGETFTDSLRSTHYFPEMALQMLKVGEDSGTLDSQLDKAADFLEADAEVAVKQSVQALGILIFLVIAIQIGSQVISMWGGTMNGIMDEGEKMANGG